MYAYNVHFFYLTKGSYKDLTTLCSYEESAKATPKLQLIFKRLHVNVAKTDHQPCTVLLFTKSYMT